MQAYVLTGEDFSTVELIPKAITQLRQVSPESCVTVLIPDSAKELAKSIQNALVGAVNVSVELKGESELHVESLVFADPGANIIATQDLRHITKPVSTVFDKLVLDLRRSRCVNAIDPKEICTLVSSIFRGEQYLDLFYENCLNIQGYSSIPHYLVCAETTALERNFLSKWIAFNRNAVLLKLARDPGLYSCWNLAISLARTEYVGNANVDDLRHPEHVERLVAHLEKNEKVGVAASAIVAVSEWGQDFASLEKSKPWFTDRAGYFTSQDLAIPSFLKNGSISLRPNNLPHCMPVWRRRLHDRFGYFDEAEFGTYADWAFWLNCLREEWCGYLDGAPLGSYFINPSSHNRRGNELAQLHRKIERRFRWLFDPAKKEHKSEVPAQISLIDGRHVERKLQLTGMRDSYGLHRNAYNRIVETLLPLQHNGMGVSFIPFIEKYFVWGNSPGEAASRHPRPLLKNWVGILHVPFDAPAWFDRSVSPESIFESDLWNLSLPSCCGVICFSENLRSDVQRWYPDLPTLSVMHPTSWDDCERFSLDAYEKSPKLVQIGDWLRKLQAIYMVEAPGHTKIMLEKVNTSRFLEREIAHIGDHRNTSVEIRRGLSNVEYDRLLATSVAFAWLYATEANNLIIECIVRSTPIIVNPLPSVIEYLGHNYPLYMQSLDEVPFLLRDTARIHAAHEYLAQDVIRERLSYKAFLRSLAFSEFYQKIPPSLEESES